MDVYPRGAVFRKVPDYLVFLRSTQNENDDGNESSKAAGNIQSSSKEGSNFCGQRESGARF